MAPLEDFVLFVKKSVLYDDSKNNNRERERDFYVSLAWLHGTLNGYANGYFNLQQTII